MNVGRSCGRDGGAWDHRAVRVSYDAINRTVCTRDAQCLLVSVGDSPRACSLMTREKVATAKSSAVPSLAVFTRAFQCDGRDCSDDGKNSRLCSWRVAETRSILDLDAVGIIPTRF